MENRAPQAGGCLLLLAIIAGLAIGIAINQVSYGVMIGTFVGLAIAIAFWLIDRRRRP